MATSPRKRAAKAKTETSKLVEALKFISLILKKEGEIKDTHVYLDNKMAIAFNGILAAGHPIDEELKACPHNDKFLNALLKCGSSIAITQLDETRLSIKSDKMKVVIPCVDNSYIYPTIYPDNPQYDITPKFFEALHYAAQLAKDDSDDVVTSSVLLNGGSVVGTDRKMIFEYWHGFNLPSGIAIPKVLVSAILKNEKSTNKLGFSRSSITIWNEDGSWLKSQLFADPWPDINRILNVESNPLPFPKDLHNAIKSIEGFSEDGLIRFTPQGVRTHDDDNIGAQYEIDGVPNGIIVSAKQLSIILTLANKIDWFTKSGNIIFFGDNIRGALAGRSR